MFSRMRFVGGLAVVIIFVAYFFMSAAARMGPTPAAEIERTTQFYAEVAMSWTNVLYLLCAAVWLIGSVAHGFVLASSRRPARVLALLPIAAVLGMVWIVFAQVTSGTPSQFPDAGDDPADWIVLTALVGPFVIQVLDLLLPPWPFRLAGMGSGSETSYV